MPNETTPQHGANPMALHISPEERESIARHICLLLNVNPDDKVAHPAPPDGQGFAPAILLHSPRWRLIAQDVPIHLAWFSAIGAWLEDRQRLADSEQRRAAKLIAVPGADDGD